MEGKIFASLIFTDIKNTGIVNLVAQRTDFGGPLCGGPRGGGTPKVCRNMCLLSICDIKKLTPYFEPSKKLFFRRSILGESPRGGTPKRCHNICLLDCADIKKN